MTKLRSPLGVLALAFLAVGSLVGCNSADTAAVAQAEATSTTADDEQFALPQGSADDLLSFIQKLATPEPFKNEAEMNAYKAKASRAIGAAADRVLNKDPSDAQINEAIGWKLVSFQILGELGDAEAAKQSEQYLDKMAGDKRLAARASAARLRFQEKTKGWQSQNAAQRLAVLKEYSDSLKANGVAVEDALQLLSYSDMCSAVLFPTSTAPVPLYNELLPLVRDSKAKEVNSMAGDLEAAIRRLDLPGKKLEIEGQLFDGKQLDWNSYRGKVVLVDFWASDCGECLAEMPNLVKLYRGYHDKGFEIIGVNLDHDRQVVTELIAKSNLAWPQLFDDNPAAGHWEHPMSKKYDVDALPRMILVDKEGTVIHTSARGPVLREQLQSLLGEPTVALEEEIPKTVPDGTPAEIMAFMENTLQKLPDASTREDRLKNLEKVHVLLGIAADKILAGDPDMSQAGDAIQMKLASLRAFTTSDVGENQAQKDFLKSLESNSKSAITGALAEFRLMQSVGRWGDLSPAERQAVVDKFLPVARTQAPSVDHIRLASNLAMMAEDSGDTAQVKQLVDAMLTSYNDRSDPQVAKWATMLEGIGRRADLVGKPLELDGTFIDGKAFDWSSYRGKIVLVDYWASWCEPCREEMPNILRNYQSYHDQGFEVIGVSLDDERQAAKSFLDGAGLPWPTLVSSDPAATGFEMPNAVRYGITAIPVTMLVDRDGKVVTTNARGPLLGQELKKLLNK